MTQCLEMQPDMDLTDVHCHVAERAATAVLSGTPEEVGRWIDTGVDGVFSVGVHPWETAGASLDDLQRRVAEVARIAGLPQVVAVGETGLDALRGGDMQIQERVFREHVAISERTGKPLVLHVVRSGHRIMASCREMEREFKPSQLRQAWIWHGFRGGEDEARQFVRLRSRNYISLGYRFNAVAARSIPADRLLVETDDSAVTINEVALRVAEARGENVEAFMAQVRRNLHDVGIVRPCR